MDGRHPGDPAARSG